MDHSLLQGLTYSIVTREHAEQFNHLSRLGFANNEYFWSDPSTYLWGDKENRALTLGCFQGQNLIAYMSLDFFCTPHDFESRLIGLVHQKNTPTLPFPIFYIAKTVTHPNFQRRGINKTLTQIALRLAKEVGFELAISSTIEGSEFMRAMQALGADFIENPIRWNNLLFRSPKKPMVSCLNLKSFKSDRELEIGISSIKGHFLNWINQAGLKLNKLPFEFTKENHFVFGFNQTPYALETSSQDVFFANYGDCERITYDFRSECIIAANEIHQRCQEKPIYVCFSGGLDSEVVCESFRYARIPFTAIIARYNGDLNQHDYAWAVSYCEKHQIPYEFFDFDILNFLESSEYSSLMLATQCRYPMLTAIMKLMESVNKVKLGIPILGSAECWIEKINMKWYLAEPEPIQALYRFLILNNLQGIPGFFQWSPELMNSYILDPNAQSMILKNRNGITSSTQIKFEIYKGYFDVQPRTKYRGYERFNELMMKKLTEAEKVFGTPLKMSLYEIKDLMARWNKNPTAVKKSS